MDLRLHSSKWAGNIYQRFEALCQEVDDIVNQGTVDFVENQMQTFGENFKKTCNAVQDLLPYPLMEDVKDERQASSLMDNNTLGTYVKPRVGITENCPMVDSTEIKNEQVPDLHAFPESGTSLPQHVNDLNIENTDTQTVQKDSLMLSMQGKNSEERCLIKHGECLHLNKSTKEKVIENESFDSKILTKERNQANEDVSRTERDGVASTFTDEVHLVSDGSSSLPSSEAILSGEETPKTNLTDDFPSRTSICNEVSVLSLTNEEACGQVNTDYVLKNRLVENFHADRQSVEDLANEIPPALSNIPAEMNSTEKLGLSCGNLSHKDQCEAESIMETIDLSDEVKLDESRVIVDSKVLSASASFWSNSGRRSYKKLMKDAFTSRRRIRKEYQQLTIMYGDFDSVTDQQSNSTVLPKTTTTTSDLENISSEDHDWELL